VGRSRWVALGGAGLFAACSSFSKGNDGDAPPSPSDSPDGAADSGALADAPPPDDLRDGGGSDSPSFDAADCSWIVTTADRWQAGGAAKVEPDGGGVTLTQQT
jgi:hypothetical protein